MLLYPAVAVAVLVYPAFLFLTAAPSIGSVLAFQFVLAVLIAAFTGTAPAARYRPPTT